MTLPNDKILIVFSNKNSVKNIRKDILNKLFQLREPVPCIVANQTWKTKYYEVNYGLYVDDYQSFDTWIDEFKDEECGVLKSVLNGLIIVDDFETRGELETATNQFNQILKEGTAFCKIVNVNENFEQPLIDDLNDKVAMNSSASNIEIVNALANIEVNEYGEKIGLPRIIETIDTSEWTNCNLNPSNTPISKEPLDDEVCHSKLSIDSLISKLHIARDKYGEFENEDDALRMAHELAEELSKTL